VIKEPPGDVDSPGVNGKRAGLRLFAFYVVVTLVPIAVLGIVITRSIRADLERQAVEQGSATAKAVAHSAVGPALSGETLADGVNPRERAALMRVSNPLLQSGDVLRIRLRNRAGYVAFDPLHAGAGVFGVPDDEVVEAIDGEDVALLTRLNADAIDRTLPSGPRAIEVYTPVFAGNAGSAIGAVELYVPYEPIAQGIETSYSRLQWIVGIGLVVLWFALGLLTWAVTRGLRRSNAENRRLARRDPLTQLRNRLAMVENVQSRLDDAAGSGVTIAMIDIDGFTEINEVLGHANGDRFLQHVAAIVVDAVDGTGTTARIGADQFAIARSTDAEPSTDIVLDRIRHALLDELEIDGVTVTAEITVGRVDGDTATDAAELLRRAGVALRAAKQANAPWMTYDAEQEGFDADRLTLVAELRHAIDDGQLVLHYQPKIDTADGAVTSVEALVRWQHPVRGLLPPGAFVPAAESTELIIGLTDWVVDRACAQAAAWKSEGISLPIAVNVSARCLRDHEFADRMLAALQRHDVTSDLLSIEITETAVISDPERAAATLRRLAERGMGVAIDDFGVGYTSLAQLDHLPISELKIDREFVATMTRGADGDAVVRAVVSLGHGLGMTVVAEGVEDDATLSLLAEIGCDVAQGYAIARPAPAADFERWLRVRRAPVAAATTADAVSPRA
jgi:diguanylate cyclase (GGDEF)-like protein